MNRWRDPAPQPNLTTNLVSLSGRGERGRSVGFTQPDDGPPLATKGSWCYNFNRVSPDKEQSETRFTGSAEPDTRAGNVSHHRRKEAAPETW
jgi:hypothetical protein